MRDTGTSSVQTAGCGHRNPARATGYTELLVTYSRATGSENYRLLSVAGSGVLPVPECCRLQSVAGYRGICTLLKGKKPASNPVLTTGLPVTENCRFRSVAGSGTVVLLVTRNLLFPSLLARNQLQIQCRQQVQQLAFSQSLPV